MSKKELPNSTKPTDIVLASRSPRRAELLKMLGIPFRIITPKSKKEAYPNTFFEETAAQYIVKQKAAMLEKTCLPNQIIITADTSVWLNKKCFHQPKNLTQAIETLTSLSNKTHKVITAVGFLHHSGWKCITATTLVSFRQLCQEEINLYSNTHFAFDKAGAYGIQDWIGYVGIKSISGSYTNVLGLPICETLEAINQIRLRIG